MRRRLWVLAALAALTAAGLIVLVRHVRRPAHAHARPLVAAAPAALTAARARWASGRSLVLVRRGTRWEMDAPVHAPADPTRVRALLAALAEPVVRRYPAARFTLADIGLAPPRLVLATAGERLQFGAVNPANGLRYVRRGDAVLLVADSVLPRLAAGPWQFLDTHLVPPGNRIAALQFAGTEAAAGTRRTAAWQNARAHLVAPLAPKDIPAGAPRIRVRLHGHARALVFVLLARTPELRLGRPALGLQYVLPAAAASRLLPAATRSDARTAGG